MKKTIVLFLCLCVLLISCDSPVLSSNNDKKDNLKPFVVVNEAYAKEQVAKINWAETIAAIPADIYIAIEGFHAAPTSALLYKDNTVTNLSVNDPRLIQLLNFYNNQVYNGIYSYSQGTANELYENEKDHDFRLELSFSPNDEDNSIEKSFDKIIVINNHFYGIKTNTSFDNYNYSAFLRIPLHNVGSLNWLSVFGF